MNFFNLFLIFTKKGRRQTAEGFYARVLLSLPVCFLTAAQEQGFKAPLLPLMVKSFLLK
jgi:hypothetical protein